MTDIKVQEFRSIGATYGEKLVNSGIHTTGELLAKCCTPSGRREIAAKTGIEEPKILKWVNMADLTRIHGVGEVYSELFEASGVDTVNELKNRNPENLMAKLQEVNEMRKIATSLPTYDQLETFVKKAAELEPTVTY